MLNFQDLPDEVVLKILSFSETKDLISCGQVSKRIRRISRDGTLWVTANLKKKIVKTELLEMILGKGCRILDLRNSTILGSLSSNIKSQLIVLKFSSQSEERLCENTLNVLEKILLSCYSLQHLAMEDVFLTPKMVDGICKNSKTLQTLNLSLSFLGETNLQKIIKCCQELKEVDLAYVQDIYFEFLAENMPTNVEKLNLAGNLIIDDEVKTLLSRCNKIKALNLEATQITDDTFINIKQYLNLTLEELSMRLDLGNDFLTRSLISLHGFLELKSMPRLKILNLNYENGDDEKIQFLRQHLSHLMIKVSSPYELAPKLKERGHFYF